MKCFARLFAAAVSVTVLVATAHAEPVARIVAVQGDVSIRGSGDSVRPAEIYGAIAEGEHLVLAKEAMITLGWCEDGRLERLAAAGERLVTATRLDPNKEVTPVAIAPKRRGVVVSGVKALPAISPGAVTVARSFDQKPAPLQIVPVGGATVSKLPLIFSWPATVGATKYKLKLRLDDDEVWSGEASLPKIEVSGAKLEPGISYRWEVLALMPNNEWEKSVESEFGFATKEQAQAAEEFQELEGEKDAAVLAVAAMWYEQNSMYLEATRVYVCLAKVSPRCSEFHAALAALYERAGRKEESREAHTQAENLGYKFTAEAKGD